MERIVEIQVLDVPNKNGRIYPRPYTLRSGMRPLQLAFTRMAAVPARPYTGLYQNQEAQLHSRMPKENA